MTQDMGASVPDQALAVPATPASGRDPAGFDPSRGCRPADFTDAYRSEVCRLGKGTECCRYLTLGGDGWSCAKRTEMAWAINSRADKMSSKGDNCDGVYEARPAFVLLRDRFDHKAGTTIYRAKGYDYGSASDDARVTGKPHTSVTLEPSGDYPFFTVPTEDIAPAQNGGVA